MSEGINIPKHWMWLKLGDACEIVSGNTPKGLENISNQGKIQFYKVSDMNLVGNEIKMDVSNLKLTTEEIINLKIKVYPKGTVIFPKRGGAILTNKKRILSQNASFDLNLMGIIPNNKVLSTFLFYWFQKLDLGRIYDGSNVPQINNKNVAPLDFPIPPIIEQQAIVFKIEELLSDLENGKQQLQIAQQQLKIYRQSLLKWAFEGKLTNKNVKDGEMPKGWKVVELKEVAKIGSGFAFKSSDFVPTGIPVVKISNIGYSEFIWKDQQFLPHEFLKSNADVVIKSGDLLIALTRPITNNTTKVCQYPTTTNVALLNQRVACIKELKVNKDFIFLFFQTNLFKEYIRSKFSETLQPNLSPKDLALAQIPVCSLQEQQLIVDELESKLTVCDKIEETISQSLLQAESLRQSILKKAFEGKLVYESKNVIL